MIPVPYTFDGQAINDGTNYSAWFPRETPIQPNTTAMFVQRAGAFPVYAGKGYPEQNLTLAVKAVSSIESNLEQLNKWMSVETETPKQLIIRDVAFTSDLPLGASTDTQYSVYAVVKSASQLDGEGTVFLTLALTDPIWQGVTQISQTWNVTTDTANWSTDVVINTNAEAYPVFEFTPTVASTDGWQYRREVRLLPQSTDNFDGRPFDIFESSDGFGIDTSALVAANKMQSAGQDIRIVVNATYTDYWLTTDINTTDTSCWINVNMPAKIEGTLGTAIASSDTITEIEYAVTAANLSAISALPDTGRVIINSEEFTYTDKTITAAKLALTVGTRAVRNTTAANHAVSDTIKWLPYVITILYGNSAASAYVSDDTKKPIIRLDTSSNSSFVYNDFGDRGGNRRGKWNPYTVAVPAGAKLTQNYTATHNGWSAVTYSVIGNYMSNYQEAGAWKSMNCDLYWAVYLPDVISSISCNGEEYHNKTTYPALTIETSEQGKIWDIAATVTVGGLSAWNAFTLASSDITITTATPKVLRFRLYGGLPATASAIGAGEVTTLTVGLNTSYIPQNVIRTEQGIYNLNAKISSTDGNYMTITYPAIVNETLYVDTNPDFPTAKINNEIINGAVRLSSIRSKWFALYPGTNTISYSDTDGGALTIGIKYYERLNWL